MSIYWATLVVFPKGIAMTITQDALSIRLIEPSVAKSIRERSGLTQVRVATELEVTPYTVQRWESGASRPRGGMRLRYARLLAELQSVAEAA